MIEVMNGDCIEIIPKLGKFDFIFADPPFNIGQKYSDYHDCHDNYAMFTRSWLWECFEESLNGVIALHGPDNLADMYILHVDEFYEPNQVKRIAWLNWHYRFGQCTRSNWIDARCHCLVYSNVQSPTWNPEDVLVESDRVKYKDKRVNDTGTGGKRLPGTIWGVQSDGPYWGRVQGNNKERRKGHPNQLPEVYLERLIKAYTNEGDRILDPFGGSGTTAVVAQALGRDCVTIDISKTSCESIKDRLKHGSVRVKQEVPSLLLKSQFKD